MTESGVDLSQMVSKLLSEPELLSQIAQTLGVGGGAGAPTQGDGDGKEGAEGESVSAGAPLPDMSALSGMLGTILGGKRTDGGGGEGRGRGGEDGRIALFSALRPFCNSHRCRTIDYMISICRLSQTLRMGGGR